MNTAQPYAGEVALDLPVSTKGTSVETSASTRYFGSEQDYKKTKKYLIWFSVSAVVVFISTGIFVF